MTTWKSGVNPFNWQNLPVKNSLIQSMDADIQTLKHKLSMTDLKTQSATIHEICAEIQQEIARLTFKPVTGSGLRKKKLQKRYDILKEANSNLISARMVGVEKILALPTLIARVQELLSYTPKGADMKVYNTRKELEKLIKTFK